MNHRASPPAFWLYLWRSPDAPGFRYFAESPDFARAVYREMLAEGYIVKAIEVPSGREFELRKDALVPVSARGNKAINSAASAIA